MDLVDEADLVDAEAIEQLQAQDAPLLGLELPQRCVQGSTGRLGVGRAKRRELRRVLIEVSVARPSSVPASGLRARLAESATLVATTRTNAPSGPLPP